MLLWKFAVDLWLTSVWYDMSSYGTAFRRTTAHTQTHTHTHTWVSEVFVSTDGRRACRRGAIGSTMGAYPRDTGSNPVEGNGHFFPSYRQLYLSSFSDTHTHTFYCGKMSFLPNWPPPPLPSMLQSALTLTVFPDDLEMSWTRLPCQNNGWKTKVRHFESSYFRWR